MEVDLHFEVLPKRQRLLFESLSKQNWIADFYLAGGTALALQIAHRPSIDFDFYTEKEFDVRFIRKKIIKLGKFELLSESEEIIDGKINSVRITFFNLPYRLIRPEIRYHNLRIISKEDIAAMKLASITTRGSRKDFVDLYFLLKDFSLAEMVRFYENKYGKSEENVYCMLKGLVYFVDAEEKPMPRLFRHVTWGKIKKQIIASHKEYLEELRRKTK